MRTLVLGGVAVLLAVTAGLSGCGGSDSHEVADANAIYDSLPLVPGSQLNLAPARPAGLFGGKIDNFKNDRRYVVDGLGTTQEQAMDYFTEELPPLGWEVEDPAEPRPKEMQDYCPDGSLADATAGTPSGGIATCLGFVKDDVRMIISFAINIDVNPIQAQGINYHIHLEGR